MRYGPNMTSNQPPVPAEEGAVKDDEVLEREGLEEELMDKGRSDVGEHIDDADQARAEQERTT
jgi:hypothetical protein